MNQVFCDRCEKEIQRSDAGGLTFYKLRVSREDEHPVAQTQSRTYWEAELCADCKDELVDPLLEVRVKRGQCRAVGTGGLAG